MPDTITQFRGAYSFLSNFYPAPVRFEGDLYPSVEHAFQAAKTTDRKQRARFRKGSPAEAKQNGRQLQLRPDWEHVKLGVMETLVRAKFQHPDLREKLLNTGTAALTEGNQWNDTFWGVCHGHGKNHLGKILMQVRRELRRTR